MTNPVSPALVIPAELKPADGRFGSGPARIRPAQLAALAGSGGAYLGTSHRQPPVRSLVHRIRAGLAELFGLPSDYTVVLGNWPSFVVASAIYPNLPYDVTRDFEPIALLPNNPYVVVSKKDLPANDLKALVDFLTKPQG